MSAPLQALSPLDLTLADPDATARFAEVVAELVRPGDVLALSGDLGAGKTSFARALINAICREPVEVPSPTFTLVQSYETPKGVLWHFDLYRIRQPEEAYELGIEEAFATGISVIEWPGRLGLLLPEGALHLDFAQAAGSDARRVRVGADSAFAERLPALASGVARMTAMTRFLDEAGWGAAVRRPLAGDASFRRYFRLMGESDTAVLMDAPPPFEDVRPFVAIAGWLGAQDYSAPRVRAADSAAGFLLLEDLGDGLYGRLLASGQDASALYGAAVDLLADLHRRAPPGGLDMQDVPRLLDELALIPDWYLPALTGRPCPAAVRAEYQAAWQAALAELPPFSPVLVLRDYFADNLLWLPGRSGLARVGLLDFQDAILGHPAYDLVSLLHDARRDLPPALCADLLQRYIAASGVEAEAFRTACALLGAQRNARIAGLWPRLWRRDNKPQYLAFLPRTFALLERDLAHPRLARVRAWFDREIPPALRRQKLPGAPR